MAEDAADGLQRANLVHEHHRHAQRAGVQHRQLGHPLLLRGHVGLADQVSGADRGWPGVRHQDQVGPLLAHDPQRSGELVVGADPDSDPPGPGIDQVRSAPAPEDAGLSVGLVDASGDLPVRGGQGEHIKEVRAVGFGGARAQVDAQPPGGGGQPPVGAAAPGLGAAQIARFGT